MNSHRDLEHRLQAEKRAERVKSVGASQITGGAPGEKIIDQWDSNGVHVRPLGQFIADELEARGWTVRECAERMGGDVDMWHFTIELYLCQAHKDSEGHSIRDAVCSSLTAAALERAFGVSAETWLNLDRAYHAHKPTR